LDTEELKKYCCRRSRRNWILVGIHYGWEDAAKRKGITSFQWSAWTHIDFYHHQENGSEERNI